MIFRSTADLADEHGEEVRSCDVPFRRFGRLTHVEGTIATVRCGDDNVLIRDLLGQPSGGRVLVADGGGGLHRALMGDEMARLAMENDWKGIVIYGAVRDAGVLGSMDISIKALGTNPRKSLKQGTGEVGVPLEFGGVTFVEGEFIVSDEDGIVVVPDRPGDAQQPWSAVGRRPSASGT